MLQSIVQGALLGVMLSFLVGPVFFMLLKISIVQGKKQALQFDAGVITCDMLIIMLAYLGLSNIMQNKVVQFYIGLIGGLILIISAIVSMIKAKKAKSEEEIQASTKTVLFAKGFLINLSNPFVWLFWLASVASATASLENNKIWIANYFVSCIIAYIIIDLFKIYLANQLRKFLNEKRLYYVNNIVQVALIVFGCILVFKVLQME